MDPQLTEESNKAYFLKTLGVALSHQKLSSLSLWMTDDLAQLIEVLPNFAKGLKSLTLHARNGPSF
jgi:hypothetical protein